MKTQTVAHRLPLLLNPINRLMRRAVRAHPPLQLLPYAQAELLLTVEAEPGISVRGAAEYLQIAPNTVSTLVRKLVDSGRIERRERDGDRRSSALYLTPLADQELAVWNEHRAAVLSQALNGISLSDQQKIEQALPSLVRLQNELERIASIGTARLVELGPEAT
ncbi:MarR family winged helix-turn-helix transcriptional regulator [Arthrobacter sp. B1805]|uniref:MarR family winged helix-turn-helix transcriptional regulator n=1 Tax=Arthrobacter sp. B1805 TaxID=2058892 RepID=UPI000CE319CB|nr:MarR family winged helix-turn-helix transcriptional regulator [Arthrobacter sp. B1805]